MRQIETFKSMSAKQYYDQKYQYLKMLCLNVAGLYKSTTFSMCKPFDFKFKLG